MHTTDIARPPVKLGPLVPSHLLLDAFELARDIRLLDMQAAPYNLSDFGVVPVPIETPAGKAEYVRQQRGFAERADKIRSEILARSSADLGRAA